MYKARQRSLNRLAALKMVLAGEFASPAQEQRFRLEAELAARVQHPNIVQIYEIGSYQGHPFLAMEVWSRAAAWRTYWTANPGVRPRRPRSSRPSRVPFTWHTAKGSSTAT